MTKTRSILILALFTVVIASLACKGNEPAKTDETPTAATVPETKTVEPNATEGDAPEASEEVAYEPAYPDDVSTEGLSEEDQEQQEAQHSHGDGEEHSHGDGSHSHDSEPDDHAHDH